MENMTDPGVCNVLEGALPGKCASLVFPYVPMQKENPERFNQREALEKGTLFPGLHLPFFKEMKTRMNCDNTALCELMALQFAVTELGLYLDTHPDDKEALRLLTEYAALSQEGSRRYEARYGPLQLSAVTREGYNWTDDPWPWEVKGGKK